MKKLLYAVLLIGLLPAFCFAQALQLETARLRGYTTTNQVHVFDNPARSLLVINDSASADLFIAFNTCAQATSQSTAAIAAGESVSFTFDIAQTSYGIKELNYITSGSSAFFRIFAVTN